MHKGFIFPILLITNICFAQSKIKGHIKPLQNELLNNPVTLSCGVTIVENLEKRNGKIVSVELTKNDISILSNVCNRVVASYNRFVLSTHIKFNWDVSFLPETSDYRCLNDTKYRFNNRLIEGGNFLVDGYTDSNELHTFSLSNRNSKYFKTVFAHELFHAMNMFYGIKDTENLAEDFTEQLGYGR